MNDGRSARVCSGALVRTDFVGLYNWHNGPCVNHVFSLNDSWLTRCSWFSFQHNQTCVAIELLSLNETRLVIKTSTVWNWPKNNWNNPIIQWVIQKKWQLTSFIVGLYFWFIQTMSINYDWNCDFWNARSLFYQIKSILILFQLLKIGQKISTSYCLCYMRYAKRYAKNCTLHSLDQRTLFWMTLYLI